MKKFLLITAAIALLGAGCGSRNEAPRAATPRPDGATPQRVARIRTCAEYEASLRRGAPSYESVRNDDLKESENVFGKEAVKDTYNQFADALREYTPGTHLGLQPANFPLPASATLCGTNEPSQSVIYTIPLSYQEARAYFERELPARGFPISSIIVGDPLPPGVTVIYFSKGAITIAESMDIVSIMFTEIFNPL